MFEDVIDTIVYGLTAKEMGIRNGKFYVLNNRKRTYSVESIMRGARVYQQGKRTVLKICDDIFMSVPEKGEKYDPEKGLLICVLKAMGMNTTDFLKLSNRAKKVKEKRASHKVR